MRNDLPNEKASNFNARLRETMMTYLGRQGDPLDRGLTLRDLVDSGIVQLDGPLRPNSAIPLAPGAAVSTGADTELDLTPPPAPTGFVATAGISHVFVEHDNPQFTQGHGYLRTHVYGVSVAEGDPLPTFSDAVELGQFTGMVWALASDPGLTWRLWIKWETNDGVLGEPAGGTNGVEAITGQDTTRMVEAMTGPGKPFTILENATVIDGVTFPAGTYSTQAFIRDAQITNAKIANLAVDNSKIANLSVSKLTAGSITTGEFIQSTGFVTGSSGWRINGNGTAEFSAASIRGQLTAAQIDTRGLSIRDNAGNVILAAGTPLSTSFISGLGLFATAPQLTSSNVSTYIANGAIGDLQIANTIQSSNFSSTAGWQINKSGTATFNQVALRGTLTAICPGGNVEVGNDVGPGTGHFGVSLSDTTFDNTFVRRSDGVVFFRLNASGTNSITYDSSSGQLNIRGTLSTSQIAVGTASGSTTFFDPNQPSVPLNSNVTGFLAYTGDTGVSTTVSQTCIDSKTGAPYNCSYTVFSGAPITSSELEFMTGTTGVPITRRIRVGAVRFLITAAGTVDHYLSIWYRYKQPSGAYGSWLSIATSIDPQSSYGSTSVSAVATLGVSLGQGVQFGFAATDGNGNYWNAGLREIRFGTISVLGTNF